MTPREFLDLEHNAFQSRKRYDALCRRRQPAVDRISLLNSVIVSNKDKKPLENNPGIIYFYLLPFTRMSRERVMRFQNFERTE